MGGHGEGCNLLQSLPRPHLPGLGVAANERRGVSYTWVLDTFCFDRLGIDDLEGPGGRQETLRKGGCGRYPPPFERVPPDAGDAPTVNVDDVPATPKSIQSATQVCDSWAQTARTKWVPNDGHTKP